MHRRVCKNCQRELAGVSVAKGKQLRFVLYHLETADTMCAHGQAYAQVRYDGTL